MEVKTVNLDIIKPYRTNPRSNDKAVEAVMKSITEYGFNVPIVLDKSNTIIAGHTRYKALLRLKRTEVQVIYKTDLSAEQIKEYRIADNKASDLASWDMDILIPELRSMKEIGNLDIFFPDLDLNLLLENSAESPQNSKATLKPEDFVAAQTQVNDAARSKGSVPNQLVKIICPECGEEFGLDSDQIAARAVDASNI